MNVLKPLAAKIEALADEPKKVEAAFDKLFSGKIVSGATQVNNAVENIAKTTEKTINVFARMDGVLKSQGGLEKTRENLEALYELLASDAKLPDFSGMSIDQLLKQVQQLDEQWDEIDKKANFGAYSKEQDAQVAHIMAQLVQIDKLLPNGKKILVPIEFNGEQHYKYTPHFYKNQLDFRQAQGRDMRKITYCLAHNIPLYIIPFWEIDEITTARQLFQQKYLATSRWKNFEDYEAYKKSSLFTKKPLK
jgi:flagellin-specific chaperone FliS